MFTLKKEDGATLIAIVKKKGGVGASTLAAHIIDNTSVIGLDFDTNTQTLSKIMKKRVPLIANPTQKKENGHIEKTDKNTIMYRDNMTLKAGKTYIMDFGGDGDIRLKHILKHIDLIITPINPDGLVRKGGQSAIELVGKTKIPAVFVLNMIKPRHTKAKIEETIIETAKLIGKREIETYILKDRSPYSEVGDGIAALLVREGGENIPKGLRKGIFREAKAEFTGFLDLLGNFVDL